MTERLTDEALKINSTADTTPLFVSGQSWWIVKFNNDGTVEFNDKLTAREGSAEAWRLLQEQARRAAPADDLRAENERLRAVLQGIASSGRCDFSAVRAALSQKGGA